MFTNFKTHKLLLIVNGVLFMVMITSCTIEKRLHTHGFHVETIHFSLSKQQVTKLNIVRQSHAVVTKPPIFLNVNTLGLFVPAPVVEPTFKTNILKHKLQTKYAMPAEKKNTIKNLANTGKIKHNIPPKPTDEDVRKLEWNGVFALAMVAIPAYLAQLFYQNIISGSLEDYILVLSPILICVSLVMASYSLGRIKEKPYMYYGAVFGFAALAIILGFFVLLIISSI